MIDNTMTRHTSEVLKPPIFLIGIDNAKRFLAARSRYERNKNVIETQQLKTAA
jgi:hypothetical protein